MLELVMIVCLVGAMLLNVFSIAYVVMYADFFTRLRLPGVAASVLAGVLYVGMLIAAIAICAEVTQLRAFSQESLGKSVNSPLILFLLFAVQSVTPLILYAVNKLHFTKKDEVAAG